MTKGKKHVISTLTYHFFTSLPEIFFNLAKRNNCFTRSFHAFSFESEFAGGGARSRGARCSLKKNWKHPGNFWLNTFALATDFFFKRGRSKYLQNRVLTGGTVFSLILRAGSTTAIAVKRQGRKGYLTRGAYVDISKLY